jgi:hypothetical protein
LENENDQLNDAYAKFYSPSKHLAVDEVIVLFKGSHFHTIYCYGIKIYKFCNMTGYTYNMYVYFGKKEQNATHDDTHVTVSFHYESKTSRS